MSNENSLPSLLSEEVKRLTNEQVKVFRQELIKALPITVREASQKARGEADTKDE